MLLFDFGAMVAGYRSDMTRTLFVGEPTRARPGDLRDGRAAAQAAAIDAAGGRGCAASGRLPSGREADAAARAVIEAAGHGEHFGHGTGHGIGLATHEAAVAEPAARSDPLPSPTVFSVEPGIYLDGETGVRIEDLVLFDPARRAARAADRIPARACSSSGSEPVGRGSPMAGASATIGPIGTTGPTPGHISGAPPPP